MTMGRLRNLCDDPGKCSSEPLAERSEPGESVPELAYVEFQPGADVAQAVAASEILEPGKLAGAGLRQHGSLVTLLGGRQQMQETHFQSDDQLADRKSTRLNSSH